MSDPILKQRLIHNLPEPRRAALRRHPATARQGSQRHPSSHAARHGKASRGAAPAVAAVFLLTFLSLLTLPHQAQGAIGASWTTQLVSGMPDAVNGYSTANYGNTVGIAFEWQNSAKVGFITGNATDGWTVQTTDIGVAASFPSVISYGANKWALIVKTTTTNAAMYLSTDNGVTWTAQGLSWTTSSGLHRYDMTSPADNTIAYVIVDALAGANAAGGAGRLLFGKSTNGGTSFNGGSGSCAQTDLADNVGSPCGTGASIKCNGGSGTTAVINNAGIWSHGNKYIVFMACGTNSLATCMVQLSSSDGGGFWTVSDASGSSCTGSTVLSNGTGCSDTGTELDMYGERSLGFIARWKKTPVAQTCSSPTGTESRIYTLTYSDETLATATAYASTDLAIGTGFTSYHSGAALNQHLQSGFNLAGSTSTFKTYYNDVPSATIGAAAYDPSGENVGSIAFIVTNDGIYNVVEDNNNGGQTQIISNTLSTAATPVAGDNQISVTDLQGFDVGLDGTNLIDRRGITDNGGIVATVPAQSLSGELAFIDTDCDGRQDGITAAQDNVAYFTCDAATGTKPVKLVVGNSELGSPNFPSICSSDGLVEWDIDDSVGNVLLRMQTFEFGSIDYELSIEGGGCTITAFIGFTTTDGKVGIARLLRFPDETSGDVTLYWNQYVTSTQGPSTKIAVCQTIDLSQPENQQVKIYVLAGNPDATTKTYGVVDNDIGLIRTAPGALSNAAGIACSSHNGSPVALVATNTALYGYNFLTGAVNWQITGLSIPANGVSMSWDGKWGTVYTNNDGLKFHVLNTTSGTFTYNATAPSGTIDKMDMDSTAQNLWMGMEQGATDKIYRFTIYPYTTILPVAPGDRTPDIDVPGEAPGCAGGGLAGCQSSSTSATDGSGTSDATLGPAWLLPTIITYSLVTIACAAINYKFKLPNNSYVYGIGAFCATLISVFIHHMPIELPAVLVVLPSIAIIIWKGPWMNRGG